MLRTRVIPTLLLRGEGLVKTVKFRNPRYIGDPVNTVRIFNDKEVDELFLLDITATRERHPPRFDLLREIVSEAFMPIGYGGGIRTVDEAHRLLTLGMEKIALNSSALSSPELITQLANRFGSQSVVVSLDVKRSLLGALPVYSRGGTTKTQRDAVSWAREAADRGAGELLVSSIDREGTMSGYDLALLTAIASSVPVPVVISGGAGKLCDFRDAVAAGASGVAAGSMFVYHGKHRAVLIDYPSHADLSSIFE